MTGRTGMALLACLLLLAAAPVASAAGKETCAVPTRSHLVEKGETLSSIAAAYGMSVKELKSLNRIRKPRRLKAGARILVHMPGTEESGAEAPSLPAPPPASEPAILSADGRGGLPGFKEQLARVARMMIDTPYRYGGASFIGIDCSAYVQMVFGLFDVVLPRTAREQFRLGNLVGMDNLSIGDLVFFRTHAKFPSHVGIYLGDDQFIHASSKDRKVKIDRLSAPYYIKRFVGARRIPVEEPADDL